MNTEVSLVQAITLAIAVLGAFLGVINTWQGLDKSRIKLRIRPAHAIPLGAMDSSLRFCIEITNLSAFAVTISDAGVYYKGTNQRGSIIRPVLLDNGSWPRRLEPRSSVTVYSGIPTSRKKQDIKCAYATTQCGYTKTGTSPALKQIARGIDFS